MFYFWSIVLLLAAAVFVLLALRGQRKPQSVEAEGDATVAALYRDRLQELRAELEGGMVPEAERSVIEAELKAVNEALWEIEDDIRQCEADRDFGEKFIALARSVYKQNDKRAALKKDINLLVGSAIIEEKSYTEFN